MCPAKLTRHDSKAARGESLAFLRSTQMNHCGELLLLRQTGLGLAASSQSIDYALV